MSFSNLEEEKKSYIDFVKQSELTLTRLNNLFRSFTKNGIKFVDNSIKVLEEYFLELHKENLATTYNIAYTNFYSNIKQYLNKLKESFSNIDKNFNEKISIFISKYKVENLEAVNKLSKLSNILAERKSKLEKYKYNYFEACKFSKDNEKKNQLSKDDKIDKIYKNNKNEPIKNQGLVSKYDSNIKIQENLYKTEVDKMNQLFEQNEDNYLNIIQLIHEKEKFKIEFLFNILNDFSNCLNNFGEISKEFFGKIEKLSKTIRVNMDVNLFKDDYNYITDNNKRFLPEKFLNYEIIKNNIEKEGQNEVIKSSPASCDERYYSIHGYNYDNAKKILELGQKEIENITLNQKEKEIDNIINDLFNISDKITDSQYNQLVDFMEINEENMNKITDLLVSHYKKNEFIILNNIENLKLLSNLLIKIINYAYNNSSVFELCFMAMFIAEKTIYFNKDNIYSKYYLCKLMSKEKVFSDIKFWTELIINKINMVAEVSTNSEIKKRDRAISQKYRQNSMFFKMRGIFNLNKKTKENMKIENEILFGQIKQENLPKYSIKVIEDYIQHFSNFNLEKKKAIELLLEMSSKYKFDNRYKPYFLAEIHSNLSHNKNQINSFDNVTKKLYYEKLYFNSNKYKHVINNTMRAILYSLKYLGFKEFYLLLGINKEYNKILGKIIYKNILIKYRDISIDKHLMIWKILLNYTEIKNQYNYREFKEEIIANNNKPNAKDIIDLDIRRTFFDKDKEIYQQKTGNILKSIFKAIPSLNYCQGMNYIAAFLLNITNNEEESFYLYLCLLCNTEYGDLFKKDMEQLKKFFYIFKRLLSLLIPELSFYFKDNNIDVSYFLSPWFITLFTDTYQNLKDKENPKILLRIWDLFLFKGWKSFIKISICLLKTCESKLLTLTFEELLNFLILEIKKCDFFQKENFDEFMCITINFKIKTDLISDIEKEYEIKKTFSKNEKSENEII